MTLKPYTRSGICTLGFGPDFDAPQLVDHDGIRMIWTEHDLPDGPRVTPDLNALSASLTRAGYTVEALSELLRVEGELSARDTDLVVYLRRIAARPSPLADLVALFALGIPIACDQLVASLGADAYHAAQDACCLLVGDQLVMATIRLMPHGNLWIASDRRPAARAAAEPLHVTGINAPAGLLAGLTVRKSVQRSLDIGTGNGIQALLAAHHCHEVVATDVNPRALAFAAFNAVLNGIDNISFREGSLFDPVADETFDLIVCNPPYVISPDNDYVYRDSGSSPAALCRDIVASMPGHLTDGGFGTVLVSWPSKPDADWSTIPRTWLADGAAAWLLHYRAEDPLTHAASWNRPIAEIDAENFAAAIDRWLTYDAQQNIDEISFGAVVMRGQPSGSAVIRCDPLRSGSGSASDQILRVFGAHDALGDEHAPVLQRRFRLAAGHRLDQSLALVDGVWQVGPTTFALIEGIGFELTLDSIMTQVLVGLDGDSTAQQIVGRVGADAGLSDQDLPAFQDLTERMFTELYSLGLLEPA
jgi:SAM-dependent methyltransferase